MDFKVIEKSPFAWFIRKVNGWKAVGVTLGKQIHISGASREAFLSNRKWLAHELVHVDQYQKYGFFRFLFLYFVHWAKSGYRQNKFEIEARERTEEFLKFADQKTRLNE